MVKITIPKEKLEEIAERYGIADVSVFGSQTTGFAHKGSDADIAIRFTQGLPRAEERGKLYGELYADLSPYFPKTELDLVLFDEAPLHVQFKIIAEGELLYSNDRKSTAEVHERVANLYRDSRFFIEEYMKGLLAAPIASP